MLVKERDDPAPAPVPLRSCSRAVFAISAGLPLHWRGRCRPIGGTGPDASCRSAVPGRRRRERTEPGRRAVPVSVSRREIDDWSGEPDQAHRGRGPERCREQRGQEGKKER